MKEKKIGKSASTTRRVLILDDDTGLRKTLAELVASAGHQPVQAETGRQALTLAEKKAFDAALIDLNLADMPGLEVLKQLKEINPGTECILITGYASQESAIAAIDLGVFAYFQKPYNVDQLLLALRRALEKRSAENALRQNEMLFRLSLQGTSIIVATVDTDLRYTWIYNPAAQFDTQGAIGKRDDELVDPVNAAGIMEIKEEVLRTGETVHREFFIDLEDGRHFYDFRAEPILDAHGMVAGMTTVGVDITKIKTTALELDKAVKFERVLMDLATRIVNVPAEEVDSAIHESLAIVGNFTGADRAYLFRYDQQAGTVSNTHEWCAQGIPSVISQLEDIPVAVAKDWMEAHQRGESFIVARVSSLPRKSALRKLLDLQDVQTVASVPLLDGSRLLGFVGFDSVLTEREWSRTELDLLKVLAALLTNILLRWERMRAVVLNEEKLSSIFRAAPIGIGMVADRVFTEVNQRLCELTGYEREELIGQSARMLYPSDADYDFVGDEKYRQIEKTGIGEVETVFQRKDGAVIHVLLRSSPVDRVDHAKGVTFTVLDIGERKRVENALRSSEARFRELFQNAPVAYQVLDAEARVMDVNNRWCRLLGYSRKEVIGRFIFEFMAYREQESARASFEQKRDNGVVHHEGSERAFVTKTGENRLLRSAFFMNRDGQGKIISTLVTIEDITEMRQRDRELGVLVNVSTALRTAETRDELLPLLLDQIIAQLDVDGATLEILDPTSGDFAIELGRGIWQSVTGQRIPAGKGISARVLASGQPYLNNQADQDPDLFKPELFAGCHAAAGIPLIAQERVIGMMWVGSARDLGDSDMRLLGALADMAANAIQRITLHEQTERRIVQVNALRTIEQTINSNLDLRVILNVILQQAEGLLDADALSVLLYNPHTLRLRTAAHRGFRTDGINQTNIRIGQSLPGIAALERLFVGYDDVRDFKGQLVDPDFYKNEGFQAYHAMPLIVKAEIKGVLEIFHRAPFTPDEEWLGNLQALATQAAIAVNNLEMFDGLQHAAANLTMAVDETLEAWARSLELRAGRTEMDMRRQADLTLRLARAAGMNEADSAHLLHGAILHDVGEIAVPETVLRKPGPLNEEEWELVRAHPQTAHNLLYPICHLRPALDIPYCHHEKWDGSGYPRGLKGEAIPLAARVFAVVDAYEALISERPYRSAFSPEKALTIIREESGSHFDPRVVDLFMKVIKEYNQSQRE